jgi:hypothetical protein
MSFPPKGLYYGHKYSVSSTVRVAGLRQSRRWRRQMWKSWAGVVTRGLQLNVLPNSWPVERTAKFSKTSLERLMVEVFAFKSLATFLQSARQLHTPLRHLWHCVVWQNCTFSSPQHKVPLCNDYAVKISFFICHTWQMDGLPWQRRNAH